MTRFLVRPDGNAAVWRHPLDIPGCGPHGWHDCTDMNDQEFDDFVIGLQRAANTVERHENG